MNTTSTDHQDPTPLPDTIAAIQQALALAIAAAAFVSASGYIVFRSFILLYSARFIATPRPDTYLAAGVLMIVVYAFSILLSRFFQFLLETSFNRIIPKTAKRWQIIVTGLLFFVGVFVLVAFALSPILALFSVSLAIVLAGVLAIFALLFARSGLSLESTLPTQVTRFSDVMLEPMKAVKAVVKKPFTVTSLYLAFLTVLIVVSASWFFGMTTYGQLPGWIGGGQPALVRLAFTDDATPKRLGLTVGANNVTSPVCVLTGDENTTLVYDPATQTLVEVSNSSVDGLRADRSPVDCRP